MKPTNKQQGAGAAGPRFSGRTGRTGAGRYGAARREAARTDRRESTAEVRAKLEATEGVITALEVQVRDPHRRSLYVDEQFILGLHEESVILGGLKKGSRVTGPALLGAWRIDQVKQARDEALHLLAATARSAREVERKLGRRFEPDVVQEVVERLKAGNWLDDAEFARAFARSRPDHGEQRLLADLARRGVARETALAAIAELRGEVDATQLALDAAQSRLARMPGVDRETAHRRLAGFLARRGFSFETVSAVLGPLLRDLPRSERAGLKSGGRTGSGLGRLARESGDRSSGGGLRRSSWGRRAADADGFEPESPEEE